jgi:hypothetical protein
MSYKRKLSAFNGGRPALRRVATVLLSGVSLLVLSMNSGFAEADGKFLDAKSCEDNLQLNSNSTDEGGACQLWQLIPDSDGWSRLQLKYNKKYVDDEECKGDLYLNPGSREQGGACQLWRLVPDSDGWSRLQLKDNKQYLTAKDCDDISLDDQASGDASGGQLWRLVPDEDGWSRVQAKCSVGSSPAADSGAPDTYALNGQSYSWYDDGWNGAGWYIVGYEFRRGFGFGGVEGWNHWRRVIRHGDHPHHMHGDHPHGDHHHPKGGSRSQGGSR